MNEANFLEIIDLIAISYKKILFDSLHKDLSFFINSVIKNKRTSIDFSDCSQVKFFLFNLLEKIQNTYECYEETKEIREEIIDEINRRLPIFPHNWEEFKFKQLMEKAFKEKDKNSNYYNKTKFDKSKFLNENIKKY